MMSETRSLPHREDKVPPLECTVRVKVRFYIELFDIELYIEA